MSTSKELVRTKFRNVVFARDNHKCVVCKKLGVDAHHLIERKLWDDGGYHVDNGTILCEKHHRQAEKNIILPQKLRDLAGITSVLLPSQLDKTKEYNKWGEEI